jgi:uncharacterized protein YndB with AHSA1/START domain
MSDTDTMTATQVFQVFIKASPQQIWDAITKPEWTQRYGWGGHVDYDLTPGGAFTATSSERAKAAATAKGWPLPDVLIDGEVLEVDPPHKLVQTWRRVMDPETAKEGFTRLTYEVDESSPGVSRLRVIHELEGAPKLAVLVAGDTPGMSGGGWPWALSDLKTILESGVPMVAGEWLDDGSN